MRKRYVLVFTVLLLITFFTLPSFAQNPPIGGSAVAAVSKLPAKAVRQRLDGLFYSWKTYQLDLAAVQRSVQRSGRVQLDLGGRLFDLELQPNDVRAPGYVEIDRTARGPVRLKTAKAATFKGTVAGDPGSVVRLLILPGLLQGYIKTGKEWFFIDPLLKYAKGRPASEIVVFDEGDVRPEAAGLCGIGELSSTAARLHKVMPDRSAGGSVRLVTAAATYRRIDLATDADYEYYSLYGANVNSQIQGVVNQIDGIYKPELGLTVRIVYQSVWSTISDPYTFSDSAALLNQFRNYWNANRGDVGRDTAHLFTGRDMDGDIIGRAYMGVLCNNAGSSYGVSQDFFLMAKLVAHEVGHNLGANHDDEVSPPASTCNGSGTIMCSAIQGNGPNSFSSRSKSDISTHVSQSGACLETISTGPYAPVASFSWNHFGTTVYFDGSSSYDPDGTIVSYIWDFGDGWGSGSGVTTSYTYPTEGCYDAYLFVQDNSGSTGFYTDRVAASYQFVICPY